MVEEAKSSIRDNSTLIYFLIAQFIAIGAGADYILAYAVDWRPESSIMEERGAAYTVNRMDEMKLRINALEQQIKENKER